MPGLPAASHFLCFAKESNQRKATRGSSPRKSAGFPSETAASVSGSAGASQWDAKPLPHLETTGRCGTRARKCISQKVSFSLALKQSSRTSPVASASLGNRCIGFPLDRRACPQGHARNPCLPCDSHRDPVDFSPVSPRRRPGSNLFAIVHGKHNAQKRQKILRQ